MHGRLASLRRAGKASNGLHLALALLTALALTGCPVTPVLGGRSPADDARHEEPGPPAVLNPTLLDRG